MNHSKNKSILKYQLPANDSCHTQKCLASKNVSFHFDKHFRDEHSL